ncbi:MAG TPA: PH domain-containing protein [Solirubrobacterales bacterium]|nr:PH domain-containing protein [Solirubrobacterales bacterium]
MASRLAPGEQVMFEGHPSWRAILSFYVKGLFVVLIVALVVGLIKSDSGIVALVAVVGVAIVVLTGLIKRITTKYTITTRRLRIQRGIVSREVQETRLERVQNVNYDQSLLERLLQVGDVDFDTAAGDDYNFIFAGVANPDEVVEQVDRATHATSPTGLGDQPMAAQPDGPGQPQG